MKIILVATAGLAFLAPSATAQAAPPPPSAGSAQPDPAELRATVQALVGFGTRHSLSSATDPKRGIGAARAWAAARFAAIGKACGGCLSVETVSDRFTVPRAPDGVEIVDVLGIQRGTGDPNRVIILTAHIDTRVSDVMNTTSDAPGANDDGSGVALVLEAARLLSREKLDATIVYALLSGEEQGLLGGILLARTAQARGWAVSGSFNNDIVGNSKGQDGRIVADRVRVFSEGIRASETPEAAKARRGNGGEDDGPSRALAKAAVRVGAANPSIGLDVFAIRRPDRFGRGGDHLPMLDAGYPAIRFTVGVENYDQQHQDLRTENGRVFGDTIDKMDFAYLARVTALNMALARELGRAPAPPATVVAKGALATDTTVSWGAVPGASGYRVHWRRADRTDWTDSRDTTETELVLPGVIIDDHFVGVGSLSADGAESIVTFGGAQPR